MTDQPAAIAAPVQAAPTLVRRVRWLCAMAVSATIFWYFGWWAAGPDDPQGPVTLLMAPNGVLTMAEMLGLAIVTSGLAVAICGAGSIHHGPMAVAVGLAALALRGGRMDALILDRVLAAAGPGGGADPFPSLELAAETWLWLALIAVGFVVGRWVDSWFEQPPARPTPAAGAPVDSSAEIRQGAGTLVVTVCVAYLLVRAIGGNAGEGVLTGQVFFSVGAGFLGAVVLAQAIFRAASRGWTLVAVGLVATVVYVFAGPAAVGAASDAAVASHPLLPPLARPLPIEYAAVGVAGGLYGFDLMRRFTVRPDPPAG